MYLVVEFCEDPKSYGVIPIENVSDGSVRANIVGNIGKSTKVLWGKKCYDGIILHHGSKKEMNMLCNSLADRASECEAVEAVASKEASKTQKVSKRRSARADKSETIRTLLSKRKSADSASNAVEDLDNNNEEGPGNTAGDKCDDVVISGMFPNADFNMQELKRKEEILKLEAKVKKLRKSKQKLRDQLEEQKTLNETLQQKLDVSSSSTKKIELVIGSGVFLRASKIAAAKLGSKTPPILARKLFRYLFTPEEMQGHSISGRNCNANKGAEALPSVDPVKRDAVVDFTLKTFNMYPSGTNKGFDQYLFQKGKILASLGKLLREDPSRSN